MTDAESNSLRDALNFFTSLISRLGEWLSSIKTKTIQVGGQIVFLGQRSTFESPSIIQPTPLRSTTIEACVVVFATLDLHMSVKCPKWAPLLLRHEWVEPWQLLINTALEVFFPEMTTPSWLSTSTHRILIFLKFDFTFTLLFNMVLLSRV